MIRTYFFPTQVSPPYNSGQVHGGASVDCVKYTLEVKDKEKERKKYKYTSLSSLHWTITFIMYMAIAIHMQPQRASTLATYIHCDQIGLACIRAGLVLLQPSLLQAAATNSSLEWHSCDTDVCLLAIAIPPPIPSSTASSNHTSLGSTGPSCLASQMKGGGGTEAIARWLGANSGMSAC